MGGKETGICHPEICLFDISYFELEAIMRWRWQEKLPVPSPPLCLQQDINSPLVGRTIGLQQRGDGTRGSANGLTPGASAHTLTWKPTLLFSTPSFLCKFTVLS